MELLFSNISFLVCLLIKENTVLHDLTFDLGDPQKL